MCIIVCYSLHIDFTNINFILINNPRWKDGLSVMSILPVGKLRSLLAPNHPLVNGSSGIKFSDLRLVF